MPSLDPMCKHNIIHGKIDYHIPSPPKYRRKVWDYNKSDINAIRNDVRCTNWFNVFKGLNVDEMIDIFTDKLLHIADSHIPSKVITVDDKESPWVTPEVRCAIIRNKRIYKNWIKRGKIVDDKPHVNAVQLETNKIIKKAKANYITNLSNKICDPRTGQKIFWNAYKRLVNNKKVPISLLLKKMINL